MIIVHDAARPLVGDDVVERVLGPLAEGFDGAIPVVPISDTLKRVQGGIVVETVPRDSLVGAQTPQAFLAPAFRKALARRSRRRDRLRVARRARRRPRRGRRGRPPAAQGDDCRGSRSRRVVALKAVVLRRRRDARRRGALVARARGALRPSAARRLGGSRGHDRARRGARRALGPSRDRASDGWWHGLSYSLDDLYPDAIDCLREHPRRSGCGSASSGNQTEALEAWARDAALPADVISSSASLGVRKPDPGFFERVVELAGLPSGRGRVRRRSRGQRRAAGAGCRARRGACSPRALGAAAADTSGAIAVDSLAELPDALASLDDRSGRVEGRARGGCARARGRRAARARRRRDRLPPWPGRPLGRRRDRPRPDRRAPRRRRTSATSARSFRRTTSSTETRPRSTCSGRPTGRCATPAGSS